MMYLEKRKRKLPVLHKNSKMAFSRGFQKDVFSDKEKLFTGGSKPEKHCKSYIVNNKIKIHMYVWTSPHFCLITPLQKAPTAGSNCGWIQIKPALSEKDLKSLENHLQIEGKDGSWQDKEQKRDGRKGGKARERRLIDGGMDAQTSESMNLLLTQSASVKRQRGRERRSR